MTMSKWREALDKFLELNECDILQNAGSVRSDVAKELAAREYAKFDAKRREIEAREPTSDFDKEVVDKIKRLEQS